MINYTTPTISLVVEGVTLEGDIYVTLEQGRIELTKTGEDLTVTNTTHDQVTDTNISFMLSQTESAQFKFNMACNVQVNWITASGIRRATEIKSVPVMRNLLDEVIEYGN